MKNNQFPDKLILALSTGDIETAFSISTVHYSIYGVVIHGQQLGRTIGFPTANLELIKNSSLLIARGVYAVKIRIGKRVFSGMANIGIRPTLEQHKLTIEVNIFNFSEDIYGQTIQVFFMDRIREEKKFASLDFLKQQLLLDKINAEEKLLPWNDFDPNTI